MEPRASNRPSSHFGRSANPFKPGFSPYRAKGLAYRNIHAVIDELVPGGKQAILFALDPATREFVTQPFLASSWYDFLPSEPLIRAAAQVAGRDARTFSREVGARWASSDVQGVYRLLLRFLSPGMLVDRIGKVASQYYDFSPLETLSFSREARSGEFVRRRYPAPVVETYQYGAEGYVKQLLGMGGTNDVVWIHHYEPAGTGPEGIDLVDLYWKVRWA